MIKIDYLGFCRKVWILYVSFDVKRGFIMVGGFGVESGIWGWECDSLESLMV